MVSPPSGPLVVIMQARHPGPRCVSRIVPSSCRVTPAQGRSGAPGDPQGRPTTSGPAPGDVALQIADYVPQRRAIVAHLSVYGSLAGRPICHRTPKRSRRAWPPCSPHRRQPCSPEPTGLAIVDALAQLRPLPSATPAVSGS